MAAADSSPVPIPVIALPAGVPPISGDLVDALSGLLPGYIAERRWFRAKTRTIERVQIDDVVTLSQISALFVLRIVYKAGEPDSYLLPLSFSANIENAVRDIPSSEPLATIRTPQGSEILLYNAFANPGFRSLIVKLIDENGNARGERGEFSARRIAGPGSPEHLNSNLESSVSRAEQSNTSVIYGDRYILKLFRKIEEGINPDLEIGAFLTRQGFTHTPSVLGVLEYRQDGSHASYAAGLLQRFVANRGDAWKYTLESLSGFFERALTTGEPPVVPSSHPLDLMLERLSSSVEDLIGLYLQSARLLGTRTAQMHQALANSPDPDFAPEPFGRDDSRKLHSEMQQQADSAFEALRSHLSRDASSDARELLEHESSIRRRFEDLQHTSFTTHRIRIHGDYHLGQVLYTGDDFMIIDFEGEPARPLEERRNKAIALRDVAGMIRSFQYAAYAALFGQVTGSKLRAAPPELTAQWSAFWYAWVSRSYLEGYLETAAPASFLPSSNQELRRLLDAFLLHKALYEVAYELNNRPAWVRIPIRGILSLIA